LSDLICCESAKKSELIQDKAKNWPKEEGRIIVIEEIQDEFSPTWEQIFYCPFCGKKITKESLESYTAENLASEYLDISQKAERSP